MDLNPVCHLWYLVEQKTSSHFLNSLLFWFLSLIFPDLSALLAILSLSDPNYLNLFFFNWSIVAVQYYVSYNVYICMQ